LAVPRVTFGNRDYLPVGLLTAEHNRRRGNFALYAPRLWNMARFALAPCIGSGSARFACGNAGLDFSYSNTGLAGTPSPPETDREEPPQPTAGAESILLAREAHVFPATIARYLDPRKKCPQTLRAAHDHKRRSAGTIYNRRASETITERLGKCRDCTRDDHEGCSMLERIP